MTELPPLSAEIYRNVRRLKFRVRREVRTALAGAYASAFRGPGIEFSEFGPYHAGDDARRIDWLVSARRQALYVRRHSEERELRVLIALDVSASMADAGAPTSKRERAAALAATVALAAAWNGDRVGGVLFTDRIEAVFPPRRGERHALSLVGGALAGSARHARTDLRPVLRFVRNMRGHAVVMLISDLLTEPAPTDEDVLRLLRPCARRHTVVAVQLAGVESRLPRGVVLSVTDPESGRRGLVDLHGAGPPTQLPQGQVRVRHVLTAAGVRTACVGPDEDGILALRALLHSGR